MQIRTAHTPSILLAVVLVSCTRTSRAPVVNPAPPAGATQPAAIGMPLIVRDEAGQAVRATLSGRAITDANCEAVGRMQTLRRVMVRCAPEEHQLTEAGLAHLAGLQQLETLEFVASNRRISRAMMARIHRMTALRELRISYSGIDAEAAADIAAMRLSVLHVTRSQDWTDEHARRVAACPSIQRLDFSLTGITDACLPDLANMKSLGRLDVSITDITQQGVDHHFGERKGVVVGAK